MDLLTILIVLLVVGVILYLINRFAPIDPNIKQIINWIVIGVVIIWLLKALGFLDYLSRVHV